MTKPTVDDADTDTSTSTEFLSFQEIFRWPKVELHAHLNGCISEKTLFELAEERGQELSSRHFHHSTSSQEPNAESPLATPEIKNHDLEDEHTMYNVAPRSLQDCFQVFAEISKAVNDLPALRRITVEALREFALHHVAYLELRTTPKRLLVKHSSDNGSNDKDSVLASKRQYLETVLDVMREFEQNEHERYERETKEEESNDNNDPNNSTTPKQIRLPLVCRLIVAIDRGRSLEEAQENVQLAIDMMTATSPNSDKNNNNVIVGMDIGGNPTVQDFRLFQPLLERARQAGLRITVHCAEIPCGEISSSQEAKTTRMSSDNGSSSSNPPPNADKLQRAREELEAILTFRPDRLGHALLLPKDIQEQMLRQHSEASAATIPIETCPTSNVMTLELTSGTASRGNLVKALRESHPTLSQWMAAGRAANHSNNKNDKDKTLLFPLAICTDDPGVFCTTATQELVLVQHALNVPAAALQQVVFESLDHAFCDDQTKTTIRQRWKRHYDRGFDDEEER